MYLLFALILLFFSSDISAETLTFVGEDITRQFPLLSCYAIEKYHVITAYTDREPVGSIECQLHPQGESAQLDIYVPPCMRNCGIGTALFEKAYEYARAHKYKHLTLRGQECGASFEFVKKLMRQYAVTLEQCSSDTSLWRVIIEVN